MSDLGDLIIKYNTVVAERDVLNELLERRDTTIATLRMALEKAGGQFQAMAEEVGRWHDLWPHFTECANDARAALGNSTEKEKP